MMEKIFVMHVSKWINAYDNVNTLEWLEKFINSSNQREEIKSMLRSMLQQRVNAIAAIPRFTKVNDDIYLMDEYGLPGIFNKKYTAIKKVVQLKQLGFTATVMDDYNYYRIRLINSAPINPIPAS